MKIVISPHGREVHKEIKNHFITEKLEAYLDLQGLPTPTAFMVSKYTPIAKYDIFTVSLEIGFDGIKTPLTIGQKTFIGPVVVPIIDDFLNYIKTIMELSVQKERWEQYKNIKFDEKYIIEEGFQITSNDGVLPSSVFKYERRFIERIPKMYAIIIDINNIVKNKSDLQEEYYDTLSSKNITVQTFTPITPEKPPAPDVEIVYNYPPVVIPIQTITGEIDVQLSYEVFKNKIMLYATIVPYFYAPIDFEVFLYNYNKTLFEPAIDAIKKAPDFYNPVKDKAIELIKEYSNYLDELAKIAKSEKQFGIFSPDNKITPNYDEYIQPTPEGFIIVEKCRGDCTEALQRAEEFEQDILNALAKTYMIIF